MTGEIVHGTGTAKNVASFSMGLLIAAGLFIATAKWVGGAQHSDIAVTGATNAAEAIREKRFRSVDLNADGYLSPDEVTNSDPALKRSYASLDENDDGRLSEREYVLNGRSI